VQGGSKKIMNYNYMCACLPRGVHLGSSWGKPRWMSGGWQGGSKECNGSVDEVRNHQNEVF